MAEPSAQMPPIKASALTTLLNNTSVEKSPQNALAIQTLHNLQYQHLWTELQLHVSRPSAITSPIDSPQSSLSRTSDPFALSSDPNALTPLPTPVISGRPSKPLYINPEVQAYMIKTGIKDTEIPIEVEWVLPISLGEKWTLRQFAEVFDSLPEREPVHWVKLENGLAHQDSKRLLLGMLSHAGMGGDGTLVYYIMQEGDVKPRQN